MSTAFQSQPWTQLSHEVMDRRFPSSVSNMSGPVSWFLNTNREGSAWLEMVIIRSALFSFACDRGDCKSILFDKLLGCERKANLKKINCKVLGIHFISASYVDISNSFITTHDASLEPSVSLNSKDDIYENYFLLNDMSAEYSWMLDQSLYVTHYILIYREYIHRTRTEKYLAFLKDLSI